MQNIRRRGLAPLTAFLVMLAVAGCGGGSDERASGREAMRVAGQSVLGESIEYADLGDTDTVLWFWAPW